VQEVVSSGTQRLRRATASDPGPAQEAPFRRGCRWQPSCFVSLGSPRSMIQKARKKIMRKTLLAISIVMLLIGGIAAGQSRAPGKKFDNQYLTVTIVPGWTVRPSVDQKLNIVHGKYLLSINPIFTHASGVTGGRFSEIVGGMPSVDAVMGKVDGPASGIECAQTPAKGLTITKAMTLSNLYTDSSKSENGCSLPSGGQPVWFGSYFSDEGSESEYSITLTYDTTDVNRLPKKGSPELRHIFSDVVAMLKTLDLKPPLLISKVDPPSASPGATVTIYGSGFSLPNFNIAVSFSDFPNNPMPDPKIAADGKSLTFQVPDSIDTISCQSERILVGGFCVPAPANHVNVNDCPPKKDGSTNFCGIPIPPATYQISVTAEGFGVSSNPVPFMVGAPKPSSVSISLIYPNYGTSAGDTITVGGSGFTPIGNTVKIGSAVVNDIFSTDGNMITFQALAPSGLIPAIRIYKASVSNAKGESNSITFDYR
jgi:hypothetical protein